MHPILPAFTDPTLRSFACCGRSASQGRRLATFGKQVKPAESAFRMVPTGELSSLHLRATGNGMHSRRIPSAYRLSQVRFTACHSEAGIVLAGNLPRWAQAASHASVTSSESEDVMRTPHVSSAARIHSSKLDGRQTNTKDLRAARNTQQTDVSSQPPVSSRSCNTLQATCGLALVCYELQGAASAIRSPQSNEIKTNQRKKQTSEKVEPMQSLSLASQSITGLPVNPSHCLNKEKVQDEAPKTCKALDES